MTSLSLMWADWVRALCNHLWQSTLFAGVVVLLTLALRRNRARTRYWLWLAASAKFLVPFSLLVGLVGHLAWHSSANVEQSGASGVIQQMSQPLMEMGAVSTQIDSIAVQPRASRYPAILAVVWLAGFLMVLALWVVQWRRVLKAMGAAERMEGGREMEILRRVQESARLPRRMEILCSRDSMEPGVFGLLRPVLLWPAGISLHLDDAQLESVLAHEVCHVRWRDNLTSLVPMLVQTVFWFHPMVWWMERQLVKERELACDEEVVGLCERPQAYAESILKVCEFCIESPLPCVSGITGADLKKRVVQIMAGRVGLKLSVGMKLLLLAVALVVVAVPVAFGLYGQAVVPDSLKVFHAVGPMPSYEVATIKKPDASGYSTGYIAGYSAESLDGQGPTIRHYIEEAYGIANRSGARVLGGPAWVGSDAYFIHGKVPDEIRDAMQKMTPAEQRNENRMMEQMLLQERFKLKVHFEMREMPVYELVAAKGGLKIKEVPPPPRGPLSRRRAGDPMPPGTVTRSGIGKMTAMATTMPAFINMLASEKDLGGRPIVDKTGFTGNFDVVGMTWTPPSPDAEGASLFAALQETLGMKLVPGKAPVEVVVLDSIERPTEN